MLLSMLFNLEYVFIVNQNKNNVWNIEDIHLVSLFLLFENKKNEDFFLYYKVCLKAILGSIKQNWCYSNYDVLHGKIFVKTNIICERNEKININKDCIFVTKYKNIIDWNFKLWYINLGKKVTFLSITYYFLEKYIKIILCKGEFYGSNCNR